MPNILDRYAHDYRDMKMSEKELKLLLKLFVMELLPREIDVDVNEFMPEWERFNYYGYNSCRTEIIKRIGEER